jgi:hypothetical protein
MVLLKPLVSREYLKTEAGENKTGVVAGWKFGGSYGRKTN